jgi:nucleoside-diphosphate-sugar epimerase
MIQQGSKIYITGVAGMIGSNVARELLELGFTVIGIDNLWRGTRSNINQLIENQGFSFRHADLISDHDWYRDMNADDTLIHIADIVAGIGYVFSNEWMVFQKNLLINTSVARVVNFLTPKQFIYLGTVCSYPQEMQRSVSVSKLAEKDKLPADPESGYGWSKLAGEIEFRLATKDLDTKFTVLDLHNVYGWPCVYKNSTSQVIPALINKALNSEDNKLSVWGDGRRGRAFVHVADVVLAIKLVLNYSGEQSAFMIGPDRCTTIAELASIIQEHPKVNIDEIVFDPTKPTGDIGRFADSSLALAELGWEPTVELCDGVHRLIDQILNDG